MKGTVSGATAGSLVLLAVAPLWAPLSQGATVTIKPEEYPGAFRNPFKGIFTSLPPNRSVATLRSSPLRSTSQNLDKLGSMLRYRRAWNTFEVHERDGTQKIKDAIDEALKGVEGLNYSLRFRIVLDSGKWGPKPAPGQSVSDAKFPKDLPVEDYTNQTPYFRQRCRRIIEKCAEAFDGDQRVFCFQLGIVGRYGESHHPAPTPETQAAIGQACLDHFKITPVTKRNIGHYERPQFKGRFGIFNDAIGNAGCGIYHEKTVQRKYPDLWKTKPIHGEVGLNMKGAGSSDVEIYERDTSTRWLINTARFGHYSHFDWIRVQWKLTEGGVRNMKELHRHLGYRYVITECKYPDRLRPGRSFTVSFKVKNVGAAPMYFNWPVELSLLQPRTRRPVWKKNFSGVDIRKWIGGEGYPTPADAQYSNYQDVIHSYRTPPPVYTVQDTFALPSRVPSGTYIVALAVLDPNGRPGLRFAVKNYFNGGRHPMGYVGVNRTPSAALRSSSLRSTSRTQIAAAGFDDLFDDPFCRLRPSSRGYRR